MGSDQLRNSFGKNDTMGRLKRISPFASKIFKSILFAVCHTSVMTISLRIWCSLKRYLLIWWFSFFSLNCCLTVKWYCYGKIENKSIMRVQILSFIQSSAHLMIIPWFPVEPSIIFFLHFTQRSDKSEENEDSKVNRKEEYKNGKEKEGRENGNVNHHTTEQPSKKRKEDLPESNSEVKKPPLEKKKVCKPFDHHPLLFQN